MKSLNANIFVFGFLKASNFIMWNFPKEIKRNEITLKRFLKRKNRSGIFASIVITSWRIFIWTKDLKKMQIKWDPFFPILVCDAYKHFECSAHPLLYHTHNNNNLFWPNGNLSLKKSVTCCFLSHCFRLNCLLLSKNCCQRCVQDEISHTRPIPPTPPRTQDRWFGRLVLLLLFDVCSVNKRFISSRLFW